MATPPDIDKQVEDTLGVAKQIGSVNVPDGFTERTMQRINAVKNEPLISVSALLKVAVVLVMVCVNIYTMRYLLNTPAEQQPASAVTSATMDDLVNDYQVADMSNEWLNNKAVQNEQP